MNIMFGPSILVNPGLHTRGDQRARLSAQGYLVRLLDRRKAGRRTNAFRLRAARQAAALCAGRIDLAAGADDGVDNRKPEDPIELRIYPGADGDFTLYEDENDNYNYEKGAHATIAMHWDDAAHTLTIGLAKAAFLDAGETELALRESERLRS
jgi:alpha-D-xyloside xylohydrolase